MNENNSNQNSIAQLESKVDFLEAELAYLDRILIQTGFSEGIKTLKETVEEVLSEGHLSLNQENPHLF